MIDRVGQVLGGRYRLLAPIGTGASATVYLADDVVLRRRVAVKVLHDALADDSQFLKRFRAEAHNAAGLNHPHIMAVHDWGQGDVPYLVTELLGGGSLRGLLDTGHRLDPAQARQVGLEAARALEYAHRRGLIHRDIKPANLLFDDEGRLRIADFGLARALAEAAWTEPAGAVLGTARYASPEQAQGAALDGRSDVYSLALVIIESVSGEVPFATDTTLGTLMARVDKPVPVPAELGALVPALKAAGVPNPDDRPDAAAFATMLMAAGDLGPVAALPLAGTATLDGSDLDPKEPTTLYMAERRVRADFEPEIMTAPPGTTTNGLTIVTEGEVQPATRTFDRDAAAAAESRADRKRRQKEDAAAVAAAAAVVASTSAGGGDLPVEVLQADSARPPRRKLPWIVAAVVLVALLGGGAAAAYVASRPQTTVLTDYANRPAAEVQAELEKRGLVVTQVPESSEVLASGLVIRQDPGADTKLTEGDAVTLVVSSGQPPVLLPDVGGNGIDQVTAQLAAIGIKVGDVTKEYDETWPADIVLGYADGTPAEVPKTSSVNLRVSAGAKPRTIPDGLVGGTEQAVTTQLQGLGLKVVRAEDYSPTIAAGNVMAVDPPSGSTVAKGAPVTITVSLGKQPIKIPASIIGMSVSDATTTLTALGLTVSGVQGSPNQKVTGASPGVGTEVKPGSAVTLITK